MSKQDFRTITVILELSEEQEGQARALYDKYVETLRNSVSASPVMERYRQRAKLLGDAYSRPESVEESAKMLFDECCKLMQVIGPQADAVKATFYAELEAILSDDQRSRISRAQLAIDRRAYKTDRGALPEGNVDLIDILQRWMANDPIAHRSNVTLDPTIPFQLKHDFTDEELESIALFIEDFEPRFVAALKRRSAKTDEAYGFYHEECDLREELDHMNTTDHQVGQLQLQIDDLSMKFGDMVIPPDKALVRLNRMALERIKSFLSPEMGQEIERIYYQQSYPEILPDAADASELYDAVEVIESLNEDQRTALAGFRQIFIQQHAHLTKRMQQLNFNERLIRKEGKPGSDFESGKSWFRLFKVGLDREELNQEQASVIRSVLLPEQWPLMPEWDFEQHPRPRPWDISGYSNWEDWKLKHYLELIE